MKIKWIISLIFILLLSGCGVYIGEEKSDQYRELSEHYEQFLKHDISDPQKFNQLINEATIDHMPSIVSVEVRIYSNINILQETRYASGVIFRETNGTYFVITSSQVSNVNPGQRIAFSVIDYMGTSHTGTRQYIEPTSNLQILSFSPRIPRVKAIELAKHTPKIGEPIIMLGYQFGVQNALTLGLVSSYRDDLGRMYSTIPTDAFGHGAAWLNTRHQLVGIQIAIENNQSIGISLDELNLFLSRFDQGGA